jgi:molybdopterin synthase catalytic subunit
VHPPALTVNAHPGTFLLPVRTPATYSSVPEHLTDHAIDVAALLAEVAGPGRGAALLFLGTVRRAPEDGDVLGIDYSAYPEMAEAEFDRIVAEAGERWPMARVALRHRTGYVPTGEASVAVAVATPHRAEAYAASRFVMEEVKKRVPVWKKERFGSGDARWVANAGEPAHG